MKRYFCLFFLIIINKTTFSQDVIISGVNKNRPLTWEDFTGNPDRGSTHEANTYWNLNYSFQGISFKGDTAKIKAFSFTLELNGELSWVKQDKQTGYLLKHEQGHFDIGLLCQLELIREFNNTVFLRSNFSNQIKQLFDSVMSKYRQMGLKYDEETNHSKDQQSQEKWNAFFAKELNR